MDLYSGYINQLIEQFASLPGIGNKSAQRLAFHMVNMPKEQVERFAKTVVDARNNVCYCKICCTLTDQEICPICSNPKRDHSTIMVGIRVIWRLMKKPVSLMVFTMCCMVRSHRCSGSDLRISG